MSILKILLFIIFFTNSFLYAEESSLSELRGWKFFFSDLKSEIAEAENFLWNDPENGRPYLKNQTGSVLWLKTDLPERGLSDPTVYVRIIVQNVEVYQDRKLIYRFGEIGQDLFGSPVHFIGIPKDSKKPLYFRISSKEEKVGLRYEVMYGSGRDIVQWIIKKDAERFGFGFLYIFIGLFSSMLYIRRRVRIYLSFGLLSVCIGIFFISSRATGIQHLLYPAPFFWLYAGGISMYLIPVYLSWFTRHISNYTKNIIMYVSYAHLAFFIYALIMLFFRPIYENLNFFYRMAAVSLLIDLGCLLYETRKGNSEAKTFIAGMSVYLLSLVHDISRQLGYIHSDTALGPRGFFVFIVFIIYILERRFSEIHEKLELYSHELEKAKENLEEKVAERTNELQDTLQHIRNLKYSQDGDYFLTSLLIEPLASRDIRSDRIKVDFYTKQKKEFEFNGKVHQIGGDISAAEEIYLNNKKYIVFVNGDAMGKSLQGAGGALVFGAVFHSVLARTHLSNTENTEPEKWIRNSLIEIQSVFESFDCYMLVSAAFGLIEEETGLMYYINSEHPWSVLYRDGKAKYIENESTSCRKIGFPALFLDNEEYQIQKFHLKEGDVFIAGSDGRDDLDRTFGEGRTISYFPEAFLDCVEKGKGLISEIEKEILKQGNLTDDFSLIRIEIMTES